MSCLFVTQVFDRGRPRVSEDIEWLVDNKINIFMDGKMGTETEIMRVGANFILHGFHCTYYIKLLLV